MCLPANNTKMAFLTNMLLRSWLLLFTDPKEDSFRPGSVWNRCSGQHLGTSRFQGETLLGPTPRRVCWRASDAQVLLPCAVLRHQMAVVSRRCVRFAEEESVYEFMWSPFASSSLSTNTAGGRSLARSDPAPLSVSVWFIFRLLRCPQDSDWLLQQLTYVNVCS